MKEKNLGKDDLEQKISLIEKVSFVVGKARPYLAAIGIASMAISAPIYLSACGGEEPSECCKNKNCSGDYYCVDCDSKSPCAGDCYCKRSSHMMTGDDREVGK